MVFADSQIDHALPVLLTDPEDPELTSPEKDPQGLPDPDSGILRAQQQALLDLSVNDLGLHLPDPDDDGVSELDFLQQVDHSWQVCDRFDLQTDIWRGRILRAVRDRTKRSGEGRGTGFLNWLKDHEITKSQAYSWIQLADSADTLMIQRPLQAETAERFSKRAFVETAQALPEVQQLIMESAEQGQRITRRQVRDLSEQWTAMTSDLVPAAIKAKATAEVIPTRYVAPLVRELEKLPLSHQQAIQTDLDADPTVDTLKQATAEARYLARYLDAAQHVQTLDGMEEVDIETALAEALRLGSLNLAADLMTQSVQLEQTLAKLYNSWYKLGDLADKLDSNSGASTPHLRRLLRGLERLSHPTIEFRIGSDIEYRIIRITLAEVSRSSRIAEEDPSYGESI